MIVSAEAFRWFVIAMVWAISAGWALKDFISLIRRWPHREGNHDEFFGYYMGIALGLTGVVGAIKYHFSG